MRQRLVGAPNGCHSESGQRPGEEPAVSTGAGKQQVPHRVSDSLRNDIAKYRSDAVDDLGVFCAFVQAGQRLAEIHVHYEQLQEYKLTSVEKKGEKLDYRVTRMKLSKDKSTLTYNQFLTLSGIPKEYSDHREPQCKIDLQLISPSYRRLSIFSEL